MHKDKWPVSVAQIGNYPPSCGGVQVHIARLHKLLNCSGFNSKVYCPQPDHGEVGDEVCTVHRPWWGKRYLNYWGYHWFLQYGIRCDETIIHCHEQWKMAPSMLGMLLRNKKIVMTIHDQMFELRWKTLLLIDRIASKILVNNRRVWWIAVSENVKSQLLTLGVPIERITVIPAFIPPLSDDINDVKLPPVIGEFVDQHGPIISTYGWMLAIDEDGNDLHSFDHCVDLVKELKADYPTVGLIICIANASNLERLTDLKKRILDYGLERNILLLTEPLAEGCLLWKCSDLYLRATTTDGDSVSVREALSLRVPVVASDACARPEATVLFKKRDFSAMSETVRSVLDNKDQYVKAMDKLATLETFPQIVSLYRKIQEGCF